MVQEIQPIITEGIVARIDSVGSNKKKSFKKKKQNKKPCMATTPWLFLKEDKLTRIMSASMYTIVSELTAERTVGT